MSFNLLDLASCKEEQLFGHRADRGVADDFVENAFTGDLYLDRTGGNGACPPGRFSRVVGLPFLALISCSFDSSSLRGSAENMFAQVVVTTATKKGNRVNRQILFP